MIWFFKYKKFYFLIFCIFIYSYFIYLSSRNKKNLKKANIIIKNILFSNFTHYSQDFEDFILFYLFFDISKGFYIDIGAYDPNFFSVTKVFYNKGWSGINIDPLPGKIKLLNKFRKRDINLQLAVGKKEGNASLLVKGLRSTVFYKNITNIISCYNYLK